MSESNNNDISSESDQLEVTDVLSGFDLSRSEDGSHTAGSRVPDLTEASALRVAAPAATSRIDKSFDIVFQLSGEREAALRERKIYKDRADAAEVRIAQLESDLSAAHAQAKVQTEVANRLNARCEELQRNNAALHSEIEGLQTKATKGNTVVDAVEHGATEESGSAVTLKQLLKERDNRIAELEMQLVDGAGAPTLVGGELERIAAGITPKVIYSLESLETPSEIHKLTRATNTVGRSKDNDVHLPSNSVSRFHARLVNKVDGLWLVDQQSVNGCYVNGKRVTNQVLKDGDLVMIGHCRFKFSTLPS